MDDQISMKWRDRVVFLEILSWRGSVGVHYYGSLHFGGYGEDGRRLDLERKLSARQAAALNKRDGIQSLSWKAGDRSGRLNTKEEAHKLAKKAWHEFAPEALALVEGSPAIAQPLEVLDGFADDAREGLNEIWEVYEEHVYGDGPSGRWDDRTDEIEDEWIANMLEEMEGE